MSQTDQAITRDLAHWFARHGRDLPWRTQPRDPYLALVSEFMLQQTQVSRVLEKFEPFITRFPTVGVLAKAREESVLALWSGLGYYRRARNLHAAAKAVASDFQGTIPSAVEDLMTLPGIGRYTAGAIASICFNKPEPIVDGNVTRVLLRLDGRDAVQSDPRTIAWTWDRASELVNAASDRAGAFNEAMMELGATVCTPQNPACTQCALKDRCAAAAAGTQNTIPRPKPKPKQRPLYCASVLVPDESGRLLVRRRSTTGMWAGLFEAPTLERDDRPARATELAMELGLRTKPHRITTFKHQTTHRSVEFAVWQGDSGELAPGHVWRSPRQIARLGLSNPQRRILLEIGVEAIQTLS